VTIAQNKLILAPAARDLGPVNFKRSVIDGVALGDLRRLSPDANAAVAAHAGGGIVRMWGSLANKSRVWERVRRDDRLLFYNGGRFAAVARVTGKRRDAQLADEVWVRGSEPWENVIFLRDMRPLDVPVSTVGALLGYKAGWKAPREFFIPAAKAQAHALGHYEDLDALVASLTADSALGSDEIAGESYVDLLGGLVSDADVKELLDRFKTKSDGMIPKARRAVVDQIERDVRLIQELKDLYDGHCQVCGETFAMISGKNYCEGAHMVPLRTRLPGIDSYLNVVILCATCHKKLDYGGMRIFWDAHRKQAFSEWQGQLRPLVLNEHIHTGWRRAP
jgi:hypothetical protein